jgi:hypothetical protein
MPRLRNRILAAERHKNAAHAQQATEKTFDSYQGMPSGIP